MGFMDIFRAQKPPSAAEIRATIEALERDLKSHADKIATLIAARAAALVDGTDADIDRIEAEQDKLARSAERDELRHEALLQRLHDAEARESDEAERAARAAAEAAAEEALALSVQYEAAATELAGVLIRMRDADKIAIRFNHARRARPDFVPVETLISRQPRYRKSNLVGPAPAVYERVFLPRPGVIGGSWDSGRHIFEHGQHNPAA
jgi:hypothetical protein